VTINESDGRHWIGEKTSPERIETISEEGRVFDGIFIVQSIRIELCNAGCRDNNAFWEPVFDDVQRKEKYCIECRCQPVIRRR